MTQRRAAVLTVSDGVAHGTRDDRSGDELSELLTAEGFVVVNRLVVPDEGPQIVAALRRLASEADLVVSTGGTGFGPRDITPEATRRVIEREAPGLMHLMYTRGIEHTPMAALGRGVAGSRGGALIINLPGSPKGATENLAALLGVLGHALELLAGDTRHGDRSSEA